MNQLKATICDAIVSRKTDASLGSALLHIESAAKNLLRVCSDIKDFEKQRNYKLIIDRCEDIEEFSQKALKYVKIIEREAKASESEK